MINSYSKTNTNTRFPVIHTYLWKKKNKDSNKTTAVTHTDGILQVKIYSLTLSSVNSEPSDAVRSHITCQKYFCSAKTIYNIFYSQLSSKYYLKMLKPETHMLLGCNQPSDSPHA